MRGLAIRLDTRLGGYPRYVLAPEDQPFMRIPDEIRNSVGFIGHVWPDGTQTFHGTFFIVYMPVGPGVLTLYGVTAAHVIRMLQKRNATPMLRLNRKGGGADWIHTRFEDWLVDPDPTHDVAVIPLPLGTDWEYLALGLENALSPSVIEEHQIGPGHEVFIPGLFIMFDDPRLVYGVDRNVPIIRAGHIAAMRGERVPSEVGPVDAYLIEARSIGGLSGSPVFVHLGSVWVHEGKVQTARNREGQPMDSGIFHLMGLVHGHFPILAESVSPAAAGMSQQDVNMGISIVVPIEYLVEHLARFEHAREAGYAAWQTQHRATSDSTNPADPQSPEQSTHDR